LQELIRQYRTTGGLCGFSVAYRSNRLAAEEMVLHERVLSKLCATIRSGPVYYSGGGGSNTFVYDRISQSVVLEADLWRELSAMGNWIADATVLRWAELTAEISQGALKPSQVLDQLLTAPIPEREVHAARDFYASLPGKVCVWTDLPLRRAFDVDHAIPFVLWRNNDLWNLLPAAPEVNNQKRDRLPARALLQRRKDCLIDYWSRMRESHEERFLFETGRLVGDEIAAGSNWENRLFNAVAEAVEFTAIQRGVERWEPSARSARRLAAQQPVPALCASAAPPSPATPPLVLVDPPAAERFVTCVPFYDVEAAAGAFGPERSAVDPHDHHSWFRVAGRSMSAGMFAIRVVGRSLEPKIPGGSYCLFRGGSALAGSREGRIVLVRSGSGVDPETGGRLTVKRYSSVKVYDDEGGFRHDRITLYPLNTDFDPLVLEATEEDTLKVLGEFVAVIPTGPDPGASVGV